MILDHEDVRKRYLECVQLHTDLTQHFKVPPTEDNTGSVQSPVLGFLGDNQPKSDSWPPVSE
ncbi:MAG: hypothetical protein CMJ72_08190 [Planctomycetaceae bacterium]|nr:hypothetical protein [Planctomycetaceae bacterium]